MKRLFISTMLYVSAFLQLHAMDSNVEVSDDDVRFEVEEPMIVEKKPALKGMNWGTLLEKITYESNLRGGIASYQKWFVIEDETPQSANTWALERVAKLPFEDALVHLNYAFDTEGRDKLLASKNIQSDPYILFTYLLPEIKKKALGYLELTSEAAQNKFLSMPVSKAFTYLAAHQNKQQTLPFDLYYSLNNLKQVKFIAFIMDKTYTEFDEEYKFPQLPKHVLEDPMYTPIMAKKIIFTEGETTWGRKNIVDKRVAAVKELCAPPCTQVAPIGTDSPTILSRVKTLFRQDDCTS